MIIKRSLVASPDSPLATSGGQNGAGQQSPMDVLAQMVSQREPPAAASDESSQPGSAGDPPEDPAAPVQQDEPGQDNLPPEQQPEATGDEPGAEGEPENDVSGAAVEPELAAALQGLSPTERRSALELAKTLQPGEIPRIAKLVAQKHQADSTIETLQKQNEELQAQLESGGGTTAATPHALPETVTKLRTVEAVNGELSRVGGEIEALTDFLDENPGDSSTVYDIGGKQLTRKQLIDLRAEKRGLTKALSTRATEITSQGQFAAAQQRNRSAFVEAFPWMKDTEHAETKAITEFVAKNPWVKSFPDPELTAAKLLRGERALKQEFDARKGGKTAATARVVTPGKVPVGKPHAAANGVAGRITPEASTRSAMEAHGKTGSRSSFAAVLASTGR